MVHSSLRRLFWKYNRHQSLTNMGWSRFIIWFLWFSVSECQQLSNTEPVMHGQIQSPQYPRPYPPHLQKQWDLWVPRGYQIQLSLTHLDIKASADCSQDSLTFFYDEKVLGKFCGQGNSTDHHGDETILSPGNRLTLVFQTSDSTPEHQQHTGFSATYKAIDIDECSKTDPGLDSGPLCSQICINTAGSYHCSCHSGYKLHLDQRTCLLSCGGCIFDKHEGHLSSPGYPKPSPPFLSCKYIISVEPRFIVTLNFRDNFHIDNKDNQHGSSCKGHFLKVTIPGRLAMKFCGTKSPGVIVTNSSTVRLDYHTEEEGLSNGWSLQYNTHEVKCPHPGSVTKGRITPDLNDYFSGDSIHVTCDQEYKLMMGQQEIKTFSAMCQSDGQWQLPLPTCIAVCGQPTNHINVYQRIFGGQDAPDNTIPWQVLLSVSGNRGGGMVIGDRWIMTAASNVVERGVVVSNESVRIFMGLNEVTALEKSPLLAASIHVHPEYNNPNSVDFNNDIALIKLEDTLTFNSSVMPVCLPEPGATYDTGVMGLVSGFGLVNENNRRILTNQLKYVYLPVVDQQTCSDSFTLARRRSNSITDLTNNMFCAGLPEGGKDSCQGDSGSPFTLTKDGQHWAAGIVSWGVECGRKGTYGVYTRVANYLNWIRRPCRRTKSYSNSEQQGVNIRFAQ
uniref:Vitamin K-dependent protein C n=2 Tax=Oreochromis aureus TaxID=47969 RepID=A0A668USN4_OREAU